MNLQKLDEWMQNFSTDKTPTISTWKPCPNIERILRDRMSEHLNFKALRQTWDFKENARIKEIHFFKGIFMGIVFRAGISQKTWNYAWALSNMCQSAKIVLCSRRPGGNPFWSIKLLGLAAGRFSVFEFIKKEKNIMQVVHITVSATAVPILLHDHLSKNAYKR